VSPQITKRRPLRGAACRSIRGSGKLPRHRTWGHVATRIQIVALVVVTISLFGCSDSHRVALGSALSKDDLRVTGKRNERVELLRPVEEVIRALGEPTERSVAPQNPGVEGDWDVVTYQFEGVTVLALRRWESVQKVSLQGNRFATARGIRIGDLEASLLKAYGQPQRSPDRWRIYALELPDPDGPTGTLTCVLSFAVVAGRVAEIVLNVAAD
jgi:hypothetical protein